MALILERIPGSLRAILARMLESVCGGFSCWRSPKTDSLTKKMRKKSGAAAVKSCSSCAQAGKAVSVNHLVLKKKTQQQQRFLKLMHSDSGQYLEFHAFGKQVYCSLTHISGFFFCLFIFFPGFSRIVRLHSLSNHPVKTMTSTAAVKVG